MDIQFRIFNGYTEQVLRRISNILWSCGYLVQDIFWISKVGTLGCLMDIRFGIKQGHLKDVYFCEDSIFVYIFICIFFSLPLLCKYTYKLCCSFNYQLFFQTSHFLKFLPFIPSQNILILFSTELFNHILTYFLLNLSPII